NEMTARRVITTDHEMLASGAGYEPDGELTAKPGHDDTAALAAAMPVMRCGLLCNDAVLNRVDDTWSVEGDPMEGALVALGMKAGLNTRHIREQWRRVDEIPFDAAH